MAQLAVVLLLVTIGGRAGYTLLAADGSGAASPGRAAGQVQSRATSLPSAGAVGDFSVRFLAEQGCRTRATSDGWEILFQIVLGWGGGGSFTATTVDLAATRIDPTTRTWESAGADVQEIGLDITVPGLRANLGRTIEASVLIDPADRLTEPDEANNKLTVSVQVPANVDPVTPINLTCAQLT